MTFAGHLVDIGACPEARKWAAGKTATQAWEECPRADWLVWWAWTDRELGANTLVDLMVATTAGPRMALRFVPEGENRPLAAIEAAEAWAANPTKENRRAAGAAARAARAAAWADRADRAARAAAWAASEAASEAAPAVWAATATAAAAEAAWAAARAASHEELCAKIRKILSQPWKES